MRKSFRYDDVPILETTSGKLKGCFYDGTYIFKGVPYAYADRFQMPVPSEWTGVKDATSYGYVCPLMTQDKPTAELLVPHRYWPMDEHCQNLNIWTTALDREAKKPVIVWFHGGGYAAGSSIEQVAYDGRNIVAVRGETSAQERLVGAHEDEGVVLVRRDGHEVEDVGGVPRVISGGDDRLEGLVKSPEAVLGADEVLAVDLRERVDLGVHAFDRTDVRDRERRSA